MGVIGYESFLQILGLADLIQVLPCFDDVYAAAGEDGLTGHGTMAFLGPDQLQRLRFTGLDNPTLGLS